MCYGDGGAGKTFDRVLSFFLHSHQRQTMEQPSQQVKRYQRYLLAMKGYGFSGDILLTNDLRENSIP